MLFSMEGKGKLRRGIDYGMHSNQEGNVSKTLKTEESFGLNKNMLLSNFVCFVFFFLLFVRRIASFFLIDPIFVFQYLER